MSTIGHLAVNLIARTSVFDRKMKKSGGTVRTFAGRIAQTQQMMFRFAKGVMVAAGIGGIGFMVKRTMDAIDATAKLSDRLQMTTEDLVTLQHAAKINGMSTEGMNKALETFVRRLGETKMGVGQAKLAIEKLGLSADKMATRDHFDNLKRIADKIRELPTAAERAATAYYLFGRQGTQMLNLLNQGSKGIEAFRAEVDRLGNTFSRIDAAKVEAANDAFACLGDVITGVKQRMAIEFAPVLETIANRLTEVGTNGENAGNRMKSAFAGVGRSLATITDVMGGINGTLQLVIGGVRGVIGVILKLVGVIVEKLGKAFIKFNNILAKTKIGKGIGMKSIDLDLFRDGLMGIMTSIDEAAKKNLSNGYKSFIDGINGEALKGLDRMIDEAEAKARAAQKRLQDGLGSPDTPDGTDGLMAKVKAEAERIQAAMDDKISKDGVGRGPGKFQEVRSQYMDFAALNPQQDPQAMKLDRVIETGQQQVTLLQKLVQQNMGIYSA